MKLTPAYHFGNQTDVQHSFYLCCIYTSVQYTCITSSRVRVFLPDLLLNERKKEGKKNFNNKEENIEKKKLRMKK